MKIKITYVESLRVFYRVVFRMAWKHLGVNLGNAFGKVDFICGFECD